MEEKLTKIGIIVGSTREGRFSEKPAKWISEELKTMEDVEAEILDLRDYPMPFFNDQVSPSMAKGKYSNEIVQKWSEKIKDKDAFIIIAPEYNHGYPAVLKNALDVIYHEWARKPVGFVSYGGVSGARSVEQLRQVAIELQMAPIRNAIHVPVDIFMKDMMGKGSTDSEMFKPIHEGPFGDPVETFFKDLLWWTNALKNARLDKI